MNTYFHLLCSPLQRHQLGSSSVHQTNCISYTLIYTIRFVSFFALFNVCQSASESLDPFLPVCLSCRHSRSPSVRVWAGRRESLWWLLNQRPYYLKPTSTIFQGERERKQKIVCVCIYARTSVL